MKHFINRILILMKKYSLEIAAAGISAIVFSMLMLVNEGAACLWAVLAVWVLTWNYRQEQAEQRRKLERIRRDEATYVWIVYILFPLLKEYDFLGLHLTDESCIFCPNDKVKYTKTGISVFKYRVRLKDSFQTGEDVLRTMLNDRIVQASFYQPVYIFHIGRAGNSLDVFVILNNCPETDAFIRAYEKSRIQAQQTDVDTKVEDF